MRILVIGLGSIGFRHAKNLMAAGHDVFGVDTNYLTMDRARAHGVKDVETNIQACIVASPIPNHAEHLSDAVNCGWHTLVEKPLAHECTQHLMDTLCSAEKEKLVVMMGCNLRFNRCVQWARERMHEIGTPIWANFTVAQVNYTYKDHVLLNWLSHECDLALYLLGPAKLMSCVGNEEVADMTLLHDNGTRTTIHGDYLSMPHRRYFTIQGMRGFIDCDIEMGAAKVIRFDNECIDYFLDQSWPDQSYIDEMVEFIAAIEGTTPSIAASGSDGLATLRILKQGQALCVQS